eukprot:TRINITY_DN31382_c1_g1_i1.p1 TRINITY_DN31382_c1_g1~~TRINITY_DN31382_c1_g1_i1.p1  ORF type:complete len:400 (-),score=47.37 TRINITY_DN31382_c1_g1_i1:248-1447(-)
MQQTCRSFSVRPALRFGHFKRFIVISLLQQRRYTLSHSVMSEYYREDGVRITHDPYAPGMAEKYGMPGETDNEGFDPYRDTVGPGIYGGIVKRDTQTGAVIVGEQYQNHNRRPGPVYAGGGYTPINKALKNREQLIALLDKHPDLVNDISTGGAQPLHMCGMGDENQDKVLLLVERGADIEALETYGMTPLHRMASNNLHIGALQLLQSGADPKNPGEIRTTPLQMAQQSRATDVIRVLNDWEKQQHKPVEISSINISGAGYQPVNGDYIAQKISGEGADPDNIPPAFGDVCRNNNWDVRSTWLELAGNEDNSYWYQHVDYPENRSYVYFNTNDKQWWIDGPDGLGAYIAKGTSSLYGPPAHGWKVIKSGLEKDLQGFLPMVRTFRKNIGTSQSKKDEL